MSKYSSVGLVSSASNSVKAGFVSVEVTLDLYVRGVYMAHAEMDIIEKRQAMRLADVEHDLSVQIEKNKAKRVKLG